MTTSRNALFGPYALDLHSGELRKFGIRVKMGEQPFQILLMLLKRPGEMVTREELRAKLWADDTFVDFDHGLNSAVQRLRDCLSDTAEKPLWVETIPRRGYRFIAPVESQPSAILGSNVVPAGTSSSGTALAGTQLGSRVYGRRTKMLATASVAAIALLVGLNLNSVRERLTTSSSARNVRSLAVLPFVNTSKDPDVEYISDGLMETLIDKLSQVPNLRVMSSATTLAYKNSNVDPREAGRTLHVAAILEGKVTKVGDTLRIRAVLVNVSDGAELWGEEYTRPISDVLAIESDISLEIIEKLRIRLTGSEATKMSKRDTDNPEAYEAFLKGEFETSKKTRDDLLKDTIVLADFDNKTGDTVFDDTMKQALAVDLGQSPFLNILSEEKVRQTLREMTRSPDDRLTRDLAREVCQRAGSKAYISGSIAALGMQYVIGLAALNCASGDVLARDQVTVADKEQVLPAVGQAAAKLRNEMGESLSSVQKFDVPLEQATTNSLEALKEYTLGLRAGRGKGDAEGLPFNKRAIELDPNFALAYDTLGIAYYNLNQPSLGADYLKKAFDLRDRVSEREKFHITSLYYVLVTGELEKANQTYEPWIQVYPRDDVAYGELGANHMILGQYEKAAAEIRESLGLEPMQVGGYGNLGQIYLALNRFDEARTATEEALRRKLENIALYQNLYILAFFQGNTKAMKQQADWAVGKPGDEAQMLSLESDTEAWFGRLGEARELSRQAVESARRSDKKEPAALWQANAAIRETLFGNAGAARHNAVAAVALGPGSRDVEVQAALAYALAGDAAHAQSLADDLGKRFPQDTIVQSVWIPTIRAQIETIRRNPARSIELLQVSAPYELGMLSASAGNSCLYPLYVRAEAYLSAQQGQLAAIEFQKILDHRGLLWNCAAGALAHLGLARAYALQGDTAKAKAAYQDFLALWKDADTDIPVLIAAKSEYTKLK